MLRLTPAHLTTILSTPSLLHTTSLVTTLLSLSPQLLEMIRLVMEAGDG